MDRRNLIRPVLFPRGVASLDAALGCTTHAGTMVGLELQTGRQRWQTAVAQRPLLIHAHRLFAADFSAGQANVLRIRSLDLDDPQRDLRRPSDIVFPAWVDIGDGDAFSFNVYGAADEMVLQWSARRRYRGGASPPAEILQAQPQQLAGTAYVHVGTGAVKMTGDEPPAQEHRAALAIAEHMGKRWHMLRRQAPDGGVTDMALCPLTGDTTPRVTRDGRFVLVWSAEIHSAQQHGSGTCAVFRADTGAAVATVSIDEDAEDPCVLEPHLYCISASALIAVELNRGAPAWSWPLPQVRSQGPPPRRQ